MDNEQGHSRDLAAMVVPQAGRLVVTEDVWEPYQLLDPTGTPVKAVSDWSHDLQAAGRSPATLRSYGLDLLRWTCCAGSGSCGPPRWAGSAPPASRRGTFCRWLLVAGKPTRPHWRTQHQLAGSTPLPPTGERYAASVRAHSERVLRSFYEFHRDAGSGPILNPFPLDRSRRGGRAHAHHNPMESYRNQRAGLYRPTVPDRIPRSIPTSSSTSCSRGCPATVTGRWWPSMSPPAPAPPSCCQPSRAGSTPGGG